MLNSVPVTLVVSTALGVLSGLGVGGGSLLVVWLTLVLDMDAQSARTLNLLFFLPAALVSILFRCRKGTMPWKKILPGIVSGCVGGVIGSLLASFLPVEALKKAFGILLIFTGLQEVCYRPKEFR